MIREIRLGQVKGQNGVQQLTGRDIFTGPNGSGKSTRLKAVPLALYGYVRHDAKTNDDAMRLAKGDQMSVTVATDQLTVTRVFTRKTGLAKDGSAKVEVTQDIMLSPSLGEKNPTQRQTRINGEVGDFTVMLDWAEFLSMTDAKRREFFYRLSGIDSRRWDRNGVEAHLRRGLLTDELEINNPDQHQIMARLITDCLAEYRPHLDVQAGLTAMLDWATAQMKAWNTRRKDAAGAARTLTDIKHQLAETDRNIEQHREAFKELREQLIEAERRLAEGRERKRQNDAHFARIDQLRAEIEKLPALGSAAATTDLDEHLGRLRGQLREIPAAAGLEEISRQIQAWREERAPKEERRRELAAQIARAEGEAASYRNVLQRISAIKAGKDQVPLCVISDLIKCPKDWSQVKDGVGARFLEPAEVELADLRAKDKDLAAEIEALLGEERQLSTRQAELARAIQEATIFNQRLEVQIRQVEQEKAGREQAHARLLDRRANLAQELERLENEPVPPIAPLDVLDQQVGALRTQIAEHETRIQEQEKARTTVLSTRAALVEARKSELTYECARALVEALGPKGLQGELVKEALEPIRESVQANLDAMGAPGQFFFRMESDRGREVFQFGWVNSGGDELEFDALSTGQQLLLITALMAAVIGRRNPPLRVLAVDNIEGLDRDNLRGFLSGIDRIAGQFDNVMLAGLVDPAAVPAGWQIWELGVTVDAAAD